MSVIKKEDKVIYRSYDEKNLITYEIETTPGATWSRIKKLSIISKDKVIVVSLSSDLTYKMKEALMKAYMSLPSSEFEELFRRLDIDEIRKFTTSVTVYIGGPCNEDYTAYIDSFGNLLLITNYVNHYNHGCSSLYRKPAGDNSLFLSDLGYFAGGLFRDVKKYQKFIKMLNKDNLEKYFEASYIPISSH